MLSNKQIAKMAVAGLTRSKTTSAPLKLSVSNVIGRAQAMRALETLARAARDLDIGSSYNEAANAILKNTKYTDAKSMKNDVTQIVSFFGGDCFKYVGKPILAELKDALVGTFEA